MLILAAGAAAALAYSLTGDGAPSGEDEVVDERNAVVETERRPVLAATGRALPEGREMLTAQPLPPPLPKRLFKAWDAALSMHAAGRSGSALRVLAEFREAFPAYFEDVGRAKLLKEIEARAAENKGAVRAGVIEALVAQARRGRLVEVPDETLFERQLRQGAQAAAGHRKRDDRNQIIRHLRRFLLPDTDDGRRRGRGRNENWVDRQIATLTQEARAKANERSRRRTRDDDTETNEADPLPIRDPEEAEKRRIDQLEKLRTRNATGLLDHIHAGLAWLALHQGEDGRFSDGATLERFKARQGEDVAEGYAAYLRRAAERYAVSNTALAIMAFLDFRDQDVKGLFEPYLAGAVDWLLKQQKEDGSFPGGRAYYTDAIALMALGQAAAATGEERLKEAVKKGLATLYERSGPNGGYRYRRNQAGDISVSGWVAQALEMAALAGIEEPERMRDELEHFLRGVWIKDHEFGYTGGGIGGGTPSKRPTLFPVGMLMGHILWEEVPKQALERWKIYLKQPNGYAKRIYTMYYGVRMSILLEGAMVDPWRTAVLDWTKKQAQTGVMAGVFNDGSLQGGVTLGTAFSVLTMEHALFLR